MINTMKDTLIECWDSEENLGLIRLDETSFDNSKINIENEWRRWHENTIENDEPLDVESFCEWLAIEHEINAERAYITQINA